MLKKPKPMHFLVVGLIILIVLLAWIRITNFKLIKDSDLQVFATPKPSPLFTPVPQNQLPPTEVTKSSDLISNKTATDSANQSGQKLLTVTEGFNGTTLDFSQGDNFSIFLIHTTYPKDKLQYKDCPIAYVPSLSTNGSENYPVGFQVIGKGSCTVSNGDFSFKINVN
jgi:hypothetical protein